MKDCLLNITGLTSVDSYACWSSSDETGWDAANATKSGYYIDNNEYIPNLNDVKDLGTKMKNARDLAVTDLLTQLRVGVANEASLAVDGYQDGIGKPDKSRYALRKIEGNKLGFLIIPGKLYKGLSYIIEEGALRLNTAGTYEVSIERISPRHEVIDSFEVTVEADKTSYSEEDLNIELPFEYRNSKAVYFVYWTRTGTEKPYDVKSLCGCNSDPMWHKKQHFIAPGTAVDDLDDIDLQSVKKNLYTNGVYVYGHLKCDALEFLCSEPDSFWSENHVGATMAKYVQLMATCKLISKLLDPKAGTSHNLVNRERMELNRHKLKSICTGLITWMSIEIAKNPVFATKTHCILCKPARGMKKRRIENI